MNEEEVQAARKAVEDKHPMFKGVPWGLAVGYGWFDLIDKLASDIEATRKDVRVLQVKEKFGGLRFYVKSSSNEVHRLITEAEKKSYTICEKCGEPGQLRNDLSWIQTLCDAHYAKAKK